MKKLGAADDHEDLRCRVAEIRSQKDKSSKGVLIVGTFFFHLNPIVHLESRLYDESYIPRLNYMSMNLRRSDNFLALISDPKY